jgi:hypothetical protein
MRWPPGGVKATRSCAENTGGVVMPSMRRLLVRVSELGQVEGAVGAIGLEVDAVLAEAVTLAGVYTH